MVSMGNKQPLNWASKEEDPHTSAKSPSVSKPGIFFLLNWKKLGFGKLFFPSPLSVRCAPLHSPRLFLLLMKLLLP
jgi:hypothetical protein